MMETYGIFNLVYRNQQKEETSVILKRIDQLHQNLDEVHNIAGPFEGSHKNVNVFFLLFPLFSIVCILFTFCSKFDTPF